MNADGQVKRGNRDALLTAAGAPGQEEPGWELLDLARLVLAALAIAWVLWRLSDIALLIFFAALFAVALRGAALAIARGLRIGTGPALAGLVILLALLAAITFWWVAPTVAEQLQDLFSRLSSDARSLERRFSGVPWVSDVIDRVRHMQFSNLPVADSAALVARISLGTLSGFVIVLVTALYVAISPELYLAGAVRLAPRRLRPRTRALLDEIGQTLRWWMLGQFIDMVVVGTLAAIGLSLAGEPAPLALALIAGLATFVPYFGAVLSAIPAALVGLAIDWRLALWVLMIFLICHIVEGYVVAPLVQRRMVDLPPALTIIGMTVMGTLFGALGIILATPLVACCLVLVRRLYVQDTLGDPAT